MKTMIIALEGLDGCGKTTQHKLLTERLKSEGYNCQSFAMLPPGLIRQAVLTEPNLTAKQRLMLLKTAAESTRLAMELAIEVAPPNTILLMDRAYDTFVAYQGYGDDLMKEILLVNQIFEPLRTPDLALILDISVKTSRQRLQQGREQLDQIESRSEVYFHRVREGFLKRLLLNNRVHVDAEEPAEVVHDTIWYHVTSLLNKEGRSQHDPVS